MAPPRSLLVLGCLSLWFVALPCEAQSRTPSATQSADSAWTGRSQMQEKPASAVAPLQVGTKPSWDLMLAGGLLAGALGAGAGYVAAHDLGTMFLGIGIGASAGIPLGVHLGNRGRGNAALTIGTGFAAGAALTLYGISSNTNYVLILTSAPLAALITAMSVETGTTR